MSYRHFTILHALVFSFVGIMSGPVVSASPILGGAGLASPDITISFSELTPAPANHAALTNEFAAYGLVLSGFYFDSGFALVPTQPTGAKPDIKNVPLNNVSVFNTDIRLLFTSAVNAFDTSWAGSNGTFTMTSYLSGSPVESLNSNGNVWQRYGFDNSLFDEVRISASAAVILDDIQIDFVPEPSTITLLMVGALGLLSARRHKR